MTFSVTGKVTSVEAADDGFQIVCELDSASVIPAQGHVHNAVVSGHLSLSVKEHRGLQVPVEGDRLSLTGWFSYDDGSRSTATTAESTT